MDIIQKTMNATRQAFYLAVIYFTVVSCKTYRPSTVYHENVIEKIDYSIEDHWAALPWKKDLSDESPDKLPLPDYPMEVDVFFIHPTSYTGSKGEDLWNADINDQKVNKKTDEGAIKYQASAFNQVGNIYAPRYRQAHLHTYFTKDKASAEKAFECAYQDVKQAFLFYVEHYNNGKPFIIASHSQGTNHAERLIDELIDDRPIHRRLVAAYLIGMPIKKNRFKTIPACETADQTTCYVSWRTFKKGYVTPYQESEILVTNPLSWATDETYVPKEKNTGTILRDFDDVKVGLVDAQVSNNVLWASKPKFPGSIFLTTKNYHVADYNFYYFSIRHNAKHRVDMFWKR